MAQLNTAVLNTVFQELLTEEVNREATLLNILPKRAERKATVEWAVNMGGKLVEGIPITGNSPAASSDRIVPAMLPVNSGSFQSAFTLNAKEIEEASVSVSAPELKNLLRAHMSLSMDELMHTISRSLYLGDGSLTYANIFGLSSAVNTLDYAGISPSVYPLWKAQVIDKWNTSASGTDKRTALTTDDFLKMERLIRERMGRYDVLVMHPRTLEVYKKLFEQNRTYQVLVAGQTLVPTVDLGFTTSSYGGKAIIDDAFACRKRDSGEAATAALGTDLDYGTIFFLKLSDLEVLTVPTAGSTAQSGIYTQMEALAKTALYVQSYAVGTIPQLVLKTRRNCGIIKNILVD